jgi:hypothetical protein
MRALCAAASRSARARPRAEDGECAELARADDEAAAREVV